MTSLERNLKCLEHKPVKIFNVTFKTEKFKSNDNWRIKKKTMQTNIQGGICKL